MNNTIKYNNKLNAIGETIKEYRIKRGYSLEKLAELYSYME